MTLTETRVVVGRGLRDLVFEYVVDDDRGKADRMPRDGRTRTRRASIARDGDS